jgi:uncharacterized protein (DUF488 family)
MEPGVGEIATIGYEKASFGDFLATLREAGIAAIIDVRDLPMSRRAGFSKRQLQAGLEAAGVGYLHLKALGTPKEGRVAAHERDYPRFWAIVERQLATAAAAADLERAADLARAQPCCLLCYEADHRTCHRLRVAQLLEQRWGLAARHLAVQPAFL